MASSDAATAADPTTITTLKVLNSRDKLKNFNIDDNASTDSPPAPAAAILFEAINIDNNLVERHPKIALNVVELRVALAMCFLEFREIHDRM